MFLLLLYVGLSIDRASSSSKRSDIYDTCFALACSSSADACTKLIEVNNTILISECISNSTNKEESILCSISEHFSGSCNSQKYVPPFQYLYPGDKCDSLSTNSDCMFGHRAYAFN
jgi:hypothetical protein